MTTISPKTKTVTGAVIVFFILFAVLFVWKIHIATEGPTLLLAELSSQTLLGEPLITVTGKTIGGNTITINGTQKTIASDGTFSYDVLLHTGFNVVTVATADNRNRRTEKSFSLVLHDEGNSYAIADITHY